MTEPLLSVRGLRKVYHGRKGWFGQRVVTRAVDDVSFDVMAGETLGLVGESAAARAP